MPDVEPQIGQTWVSKRDLDRRSRSPPSARLTPLIRARNTSTSSSAGTLLGVGKPSLSRRCSRTTNFGGRHELPSYR